MVGYRISALQGTPTISRKRDSKFKLHARQINTQYQGDTATPHLAWERQEDFLEEKISEPSLKP